MPSVRSVKYSLLRPRLLEILISVELTAVVVAKLKMARLAVDWPMGVLLMVPAKMVRSSSR